MSVVRVGVIGIGGMGSFHTAYLAAGEVPGAKLTAVCDVNPDRLREAAERYGESVATFESSDALFAADAVDAVVIATPHYFHPPLVVEALKRGIHALSEKPAGVYTRQVHEMNAAAAESPCVFGVMFNQRTIPVHRKLRDLVEGGELGEIRRSNWIITNWFRTQSYYDSGGWRATWEGEGGGVLINQCPHNLDLWQWFCGVPKRVRAFCSFGKYHNIEVEDDVTAYAEYENGATGVFITTTGESPGTNRLEITGDRGKAVLENGELTFWRTRESVGTFLRESPEGFANPECWKCEIPVQGTVSQHKEVTTRGVGAILNGTPLVASGVEGIKSLEISNAMMLSAWTDAWADIPVDADAFYDQLQAKIANSNSTKDANTGKTMAVNGTFGA